LLHELSTGQVPFSGASDYEIMHAHLEDVPKPPREFDGSLPPEIESAILKALAKNPDERFQNAAEFRAVLEPALANLPVSGEKVVLPIKGTREAIAMTAESLVPDEPAGREYSQPGVSETRAADAPKAGATKKPAALPISWITPKIALGVGVAFLVVMLIAALATRRAPQGGSTPKPVIETVVTPQTDPTPTVEDDNNKDGGDLPVVVQPKRPQPVITPIPAPKPIPKPTPKPAPKPTPKPAPKPAPKPRTTEKRRSAPKRSTTTRHRSTPKRRSAPKRSRPKKRSGGGDGVIGIIKNS
jgi:serine/threonine-protein kinase